MDYTALATEDTLQALATSLRARNFEPVIVETKEQALEKIKELVPKGASVMNGSSRTLEQVGFVDYLKAGEHGWNNLHENILAEKDTDKQNVLRRQALLADYYLGSVHALAQTGEMLIASNTGSQLPHIVYSSPNVIFVVGTQKIVPTLTDAADRLRTHVVPLEDVNMQQKYGIHTAINKEFVFHAENPMNGRKITVLLVKEALGF